MVSSDENEEECYGYVDLFKTPKDDIPYQTYKLMKRVIRIGRDHSNEIRIHSLKVSRLQCSLSIAGDAGDYRVSLENRTDKKTTVYNDAPVPPQGKVLIFPGDRFRCHEKELRYRGPSDDQNGTEEPKAPVIRISEKMSTPSPRQKTEKVASSRKKAGDLRKFLLRKSVMGKDLTKLNRPEEAAADTSFATTAADSEKAADANQPSANVSMEGLCPSSDGANEEDESFDDESIVVNPPSSVQSSDAFAMSGISEQDLIVLSPMEPVVPENSSDLINFEDIEGEMYRLHGESGSILHPDESLAVDSNEKQGPAEKGGGESDSSGETRESLVDVVDEEHQAIQNKGFEEDNEKSEKRDSMRENSLHVASPKGPIATPSPAKTPVKHIAVAGNEDLSATHHDELHSSGHEARNHSKNHGDKEQSYVSDAGEHIQPRADEEYEATHGGKHNSESGEDLDKSEAQDNNISSKDGEVQDHEPYDKDHDEYHEVDVPPQTIEYSMRDTQDVRNSSARKSTGKVATPNSSMIMEVAEDVLSPESSYVSQTSEPVAGKTRGVGTPKKSMSTSGHGESALAKRSDESELFADLQEDEDDSFEKSNDRNLNESHASDSLAMMVSSASFGAANASPGTDEPLEEDEMHVDYETAEKLNSTYVVEGAKLESPKANASPRNSVGTTTLTNKADEVVINDTDDEDSSPNLPASPSGQDPTVNISEGVTASANAVTTPGSTPMSHSSPVTIGDTPSRLSFMKTSTNTPRSSKSAKTDSFVDATPVKHLLSDLTNMVSPCYVVLQRIEVVEQENGIISKNNGSNSELIQENLSPKDFLAPTRHSRTPGTIKTVLPAEDEENMKEDESPNRVAESSKVQSKSINSPRTKPFLVDYSPNVKGAHAMAQEDKDELEQAESSNGEIQESAGPEHRRTFNCSNTPAPLETGEDVPSDDNVIREKSVSHPLKMQQLSQTETIATAASSATMGVVPEAAVDDIDEENDDTKNFRQTPFVNLGELESSDAADSVPETSNTLVSSPTRLKFQPFVDTPKSSKNVKSLVKSSRLIDDMKPCFVVLQRIKIQEQDIETQNQDVEIQDQDVEIQEEDVEIQEQDVEIQEQDVEIQEQPMDCAAITPKPKSQLVCLHDVLRTNLDAASASRRSAAASSSAKKAKEDNVESSDEKDEPKKLTSTSTPMQKAATPKIKLSVLDAVTPVIPKKSLMHQSLLGSAKQAKNKRSPSPVTMPPVQNVSAEPSKTVSPCYVALQRVEILQEEGANSTSSNNRKQNLRVDLDEVENVSSEHTPRGRKRKTSENSVEVVEKISKTSNPANDQDLRTRKKNQLDSNDPETSSTASSHRATRRGVPKPTDLDESKGRVQRKAVAKINSPQREASTSQRTLRNRAVKSNTRGVYTDMTDQEIPKEIRSQSEEESALIEKQPTKTKGLKNGKSAAKSKKAANAKRSEESDEESSEPSKRSVSEDEPKEKKQLRNHGVRGHTKARTTATETRDLNSDDSDADQSVVVLEPTATQKQGRKVKVVTKSKPAAKPRATRSKRVVELSEESDEEDAQHNTKSIREEPKDAKKIATKTQQAKNGKSAGTSRATRSKAVVAADNFDGSDQESSARSGKSSGEEDTRQAKKPAKKGKAAATSRATRSKPVVVDDLSDGSDQESSAESGKSSGEEYTREAKKPAKKSAQPKKGKAAATPRATRSKPAVIEVLSDESDEESSARSGKSLREVAAKIVTKSAKAVEQPKKGKPAAKSKATRPKSPLSDGESDENDREHVANSTKSIRKESKEAKKPTKTQQAKKGTSAAKASNNRTKSKATEKNSDESDEETGEEMAYEEDEVNEEARPTKATGSKRVPDAGKPKAANKSRKPRRQDSEDDDDDVQIVDMVSANGRSKRKVPAVDTTSLSNTSRSTRKGRGLLAEAKRLAPASTPEPTGPPTKRARNKAETSKLNETVPQRQLRSRK